MNEKIGSKYVADMRSNAKDHLSKVFDEYKELLRDKTHPDNQTEAYHKRVQGTLHRVLAAASQLDEQNPGEGIYALFTLSLATNLKLKDKMIELEVENNKLKKQIKKPNGKS
jgi:hypothetical protein